MKVALIYDDLYQQGGGEYLFKCLNKIYPNADLYVPIIKNSDLKGNINYSKFLSFLSKFGFLGYSVASFLSIYYFEKLDLSKYNLVINLCNRNSVSTVTNTNTFSIYYITTPFRKIWEETSFKPNLPFLNYLRVSNYAFSKRCDIVVSISRFTQKKVSKYWRQESLVIYPPYKKINTVGTHPNQNKKYENYFLMGGRFNKWKGNYFINVLEFFSKNPSYNLVVFGKVYSYKKEVSRFEKYKNITFIGRVSDKTLSFYYKGCLAFIHPQVEDFGLTPFEALQYFRPIIAYNKGGVSEYLNNKVSLLYTSKSQFSECIKKAPDFKIDRAEVKKILRLYSFENFEYNFKKLVNNYVKKPK